MQIFEACPWLASREERPVKHVEMNLAEVNGWALSRWGKTWNKTAVTLMNCAGMAIQIWIRPFFFFCCLTTLIQLVQTPLATTKHSRLRGSGAESRADYRLSSASAFLYGRRKNSPVPMATLAEATSLVSECAEQLGRRFAIWPWRKNSQC